MTLKSLKTQTLQNIGLYNQEIVAQTTATATTAFTGGTALTVLTVSATIIPNRLYEITGRLCVQATQANSGNALYVSVTGSTFIGLDYQTTAIGTNLLRAFGGTAIVTSSYLGVTTTSASKTFNLIWKSNSNGGLSTNPDALMEANAFQQQLVIKDIGSS
jgi:hypothetical protein